LFGLAIAAIYGLLFVLHIVFGLFIALATVAALRGISLYFIDFLKKRATEQVVAAVPVVRHSAAAAG
jgi:hypothetical protein